MEDDLPGEFFQPLKPCLDLLEACNITIFDKGRTVFKYFRFVYIIPCVLAFHISQSVYARKAFKGELELHELAYIVPVYVVCTQAILKAVIVLSNRTKIKMLILKLGSMWRMKNLTEKQIEKKNILLKRLRFCYKAFYSMNMFGSWQYMLAPILETLCRRYILKQECEFLLPFGCSFPFDPTESWLIYIPTYLFEMYSMFLIIYCYLGSEFLMITLCANTSTEFTLLGEDLLHMAPRLNENVQYNAEPLKENSTLKSFVQRHQILIESAAQLDDIFNRMIFVDLSSATIIICFFGFSAKVAGGALDMVNNFFGVFASILPIFNLCYYGELLRETSEGIAVAAYNNLWYKGGIYYQKSILIILLRSQIPCCLTSMKYNPIALSTFTTVLSTTWSYFSLASSLYQD